MTSCGASPNTYSISRRTRSDVRSSVPAAGFASPHREIDEQRSTPYEPFLTHAKEVLLRPGEIVPVEMQIWPHGLFWRPGEQLRVIVADHSLGTYLQPFQYQTRNKGTHVIHTGGGYDSHLLIPSSRRVGTRRQ